jgi:hypothetical protein
LRTALEGGSWFEGPRWHDDAWRASDFYRHTVSRVAPEGGETVVLEVENQPSALSRLPDGWLLVVSMKEPPPAALRRRQGVDARRPVRRLRCHLNDMVVDAPGRAFVGDSASTSWAAARRTRRLIRHNGRDETDLCGRFSTSGDGEPTDDPRGQGQDSSRLTTPKSIAPSTSPLTCWPAGTFWLQTSQLESSAWLRLPSRSCETVRRTP